MRVSDLLQEIPNDTAEKVARACTAWSVKIRRQITDQWLRWGLRYRDSIAPRESKIENEWGEVGLALPRRLEDLPIPPGLERAARLSVYGPDAKRLADSAARLAPLFGSDVGPLFDGPEADDWRDTPIEPVEARDTLHRARELGEVLQHLAMPEVGPGEKFDLVRFLLEVDEDVLGAYVFGPSADEYHMRSSPKGTVRVYWGAIGLVAGALGVSTRPLTVVVLAHELAHAYLNLGYDRDGHRWANHDFAHSDPALHEALAQYYTHLICERLDASLPGLFEAYWTLLPKQPHIYQLHLPLLLESSPEKVASAMTELRTGVAGYGDLVEALRLHPVMDASPDHWRDEVEAKRLPRTLPWELRW